MTLIAMPTTPGFVSVQWTPPSTQVQRNRSEWTGVTRGVRLPGGQRWKAKATLPPIVGKPDVAAAWGAFLMALDGPYNSFLLPFRKNQHNLALDVRVGAGAAGGTTMTLTNLPASAMLLPAGYCITVPLPSGRVQMLRLISALTSDGAGNATALFRAPLRQTLVADSWCETRNPVAEMMLVGDAPTETDGLARAWSFDAIDLEEAF